MCASVNRWPYGSLAQLLYSEADKKMGDVPVLFCTKHAKFAESAEKRKFLSAVYTDCALVQGAEGVEGDEGDEGNPM